MKFSSWTYNGMEVDLQHVCNGTMIGEMLFIPRGIDMKDYYYNVEWDVLNVTARRIVSFMVVNLDTQSLFSECSGIVS